MIGSIIFLLVLGSFIFKMAYDHQLVKDRIKMMEYGQEVKETIEARI
jgi:hypothetical protein